MGGLKRVGGFLAVVMIISFGTSVMVFRLMRNEAIEKMLTLQEMMVVQSLNAGTSAAQNLTHARLQDAEEILYSSLGLNMAFLEDIYAQRGRLPEGTISVIISNVSKYRASSELSRDKDFDQFFKPDVLDFMSRVEKAANGKNKAN